MGIFANFNILNQRGTPAMFSDTLANRPAPGFVGRIFIDTDVPTTGIYRDTGTTWELVAGGLQPTPNLQQVTDVGNTTTRNVIIQGRGTYGGANIQTNHRLFVRDVATFTTQYEALSILRDLTYDSSAIFTNGPIYGSIGASDTLNQTANITFPNGVSCATGVFSTVVLRPAGFNITQNQASGLRALSGYRTQFTIEQSSASNSTISHFAHYFATSIYKVTNSNPVTITNNYGVAISDQTEQSTGLTITNRFGVAQFGTNDRNFFLGRVGIGTSVDAGFQLDVNTTGRITNATMGRASTGGQSLKVIASTADNGVNAFSVTNEFETQNYLRIRSGDGATFFTTTVQIGSTRITSQNIDIPTDTPSAADATITLKAGNQINANRAGGNLFLQGGAAAGAGDGINGFISFGVSNFTAPSGTTNTISEVARFSINKNLLIGTTTDVASAKLQVVSTTQGFLPPILTETQINAIATPAEGLLVYNSTDKTLELRDGTIWENIPNGLKASATLDFPSTNAANSSDLTITVTNAALNDMVLLGVPNGSVLANTCYTAFVSAANTVTVRFNNYSGVAQNPASGTFRVYVIKN